MPKQAKRMQQDINEQRVSAILGELEFDVSTAITEFIVGCAWYTLTMTLSVNMALYFAAALSSHAIIALVVLALGIYAGMMLSAAAAGFLTEPTVRYAKLAYAKARSGCNAASNWLTAKYDVITA